MTALEVGIIITHILQIRKSSFGFGCNNLEEMTFGLLTALEVDLGLVALSIFSPFRKLRRMT